MSVWTLFTMAFYNIRVRTKHTAKLLRGITLIAVLIITLLQLSYSLHSGYETSIHQAQSGNFIEFSLPLDASGRLEEPEQYRRIQTVTENLPHLGKPSVTGNLDLIRYIRQDDWRMININHVTALIGETAYQGVNDYSYDFEIAFDVDEPKSKYTVPFSISCTVPETNSFSENQCAEAEYRFGTSTFLCGRDIANPDEIIMTDYMLERFGYIGDPSELLGSPISFSIQEEPILSDYTLVGIICSDIYRVSHLPMLAQIIISGDADVYAEYGVSSLSCMFSVDDYLHTNDVIDSLQASECGVFGYPLNTDRYVYIARLQAVVDRIISLFCILLTLALLLNLGSTLQLGMQEKQHYFGMCKANGMQNRDIYIMSFCELFLILAIAVPLACACSYVFLIGLESAMLALIGLRLAPPLSVSVCSAAVVWISLSVVLYLMEALFLRPILREPAGNTLR